MCTISSKKGFDADILFQKGFLVGDESETFDCKNVQSEFCVCPDTSPPVKIEMGVNIITTCSNSKHRSLKLETELFTIQVIAGWGAVSQINQGALGFTPHETPNTTEGPGSSSCHIFICKHKHGFIILGHNYITPQTI